MGLLESVWMGLVSFLAYGLSGFAWWQVLIVALVMTHITIVSVTLYLHRCQAHRALELHSSVSHFFRFWLWMTTGMGTKEWTAIHRKHHAKCEQAEDPHSPQVHGIKKVFWEGAELYRAEAKNQETLSRFGHGTPDDWVERNVYVPFSRSGVGLMLILNVSLFGALGLAVWALQMAWIPIWAAGVVNGIGHFWGYRNFEAVDASTNVSPWGIIIGGEELHNNHHTYPTSAKFSVKPYEFDIGWMYISVLSAMGLAKAKKTPPKAAYGEVQALATEQTLEAMIANRYEVMASYARQMRDTAQAEMAHLKSKSDDVDMLKAVKQWLHRDDDKVPAALKSQVELVRAQLPSVSTMHAMREELRQLWSNAALSREQMATGLQAWCQRAEDSGIAALREFSLRLRSIKMA